MSSANNHRRRSRRGYEKRTSTMNALQRRSAVKKQTHGFLDILKQIRKTRQGLKMPIMQKNKQITEK